MILVQPSLAYKNRIFESIACRYGFLDQEQARQCRNAAKFLASRGEKADLGRIAVMLGYITEEERLRLALACAYFFARQEDRVIARIALRHQLISPAEVEKFLRIQEESYHQGAPRVPRLLGLISQNRVLNERELITLLKAVQRVAMTGRTLPLQEGTPAQQAADGHHFYKEWPVPDLRSVKRFPVADAFVSFYPSGILRFARKLITPADKPPDASVTADLLDISVRGLQACSPRQIPVREQLQLGIRMPLLPDPIKTRGEVRWVERNGPRYRVGVMFTQLDPGTEVLLAELASNAFLRSLDRSSVELVPLE